MAMYRVLKPFNTRLRRFRVVGEKRDETEIDGRLNVEQWVQKGFIEPVADAEEHQLAAAARKIQVKPPPVVDTIDKDEVEKK
jgi:hypothetical protein